MIKQKPKIELYDIKKESFSKGFIDMVEKVVGKDKEMFSLLDGFRYVGIFIFIFLIKMILKYLKIYDFSAFEDIVMVFMLMVSFVIMFTLYFKQRSLLYIPSTFLLLSLIVPESTYVVMISISSFLFVFIIIIGLVYYICKIIGGEKTK